ncbi:MAG: hypothetical protein WA926_02580 [Methylovirgula sp.]
MIEQLMIFALGFLFAGLVALAFAPAFWRRANRLTRRRLEMQVPLSVQEILAERDQLRAEFAVGQRRLELRVAEINRAHAADRGELGRRAVEIDALNDNIARRAEENRALAAALARSDADLAQAHAEFGAATKALYDSESLAERRQGELIELNQAHEAMTRLAEERLTNHAAADARAAALELRLGDVSRMLVEAEKRFAERTAQANKLGDVLTLAKRDLEFSDANYASLQKKLEAETGRAAQLSQQLETLRIRRDEDQVQVRALNAELGVRAAAAEDAGRREAKIRAQIGKARSAELALAERYERLQSECAALQGALDVARRRCETLEADLAAQRIARQKKPEGEEKPRQDSTIVRLSRPGAESNGAETPEQSGLHTPAAQTDAETAEKIGMRDHVGT